MVTFDPERVAQVHKAGEERQANIFLCARLCYTEAYQEGIQFSQDALCLINAS